MKTPLILRRPGKLILCTILLAVTSAAALLFALQAWLDGIALEHSMDAYAYIGTITYDGESDSETDIALSLLDEEVVSRIKNSEYVTSVDTRTTFAGIVDGIHTMPDRMITTERLNQRFFIEATVITMIDSGEIPGICYDYYTLRMDKQWGGSFLLQGTLNLFLYRTEDEEPLSRGDHVFLVGSYYADGNGIRTDYTTIYTKDAAVFLGEDYADNIFTNNAVAVIPEGEDSESWITSYMEETGLLPFYENYCALENAVTVRKVSDLTMHPYLSSGRIVIYEGRPIVPSDEGKKLCVISQLLSFRNRLNVGDTIRLAVADGCYATSGLNPSENGWESGFPMDFEEILPYGEFEEYEIIGIYTQISRKTGDPLFFDLNDIIIPSDGETAEALRSYNFSFRVEGPGYESFKSELGSVLNEKGYNIKLRDTGWDDVEDTFFLLQDRRKFMLFSAAAACGLAAILFAVLIKRNYRSSYAISRILGASKNESAKEYLGAFCTGGFFGMVLAVITALCGYLLWMRADMEEVLSTSLPETAECVLMLSKVGVSVLGASALILLVLCIIEETRGLLRLIRR